MARQYGEDRLEAACAFDLPIRQGCKVGAIQSTVTALTKSVTIDCDANQVNTVVPG